MPRNGQVLLDMPDMDMPSIIKINIDSIGAVDARNSEGCVNMHTVQESEPKQETDRAEKCYKHGQHFN